MVSLGAQETSFRTDSLQTTYIRFGNHKFELDSKNLSVSLCRGLYTVSNPINKNRRKTHEARNKINELK